MRKMRLDVESLAVESFAPAEQAPGRGTVRGHVSLYWEDCDVSDTCPGNYPCDPTQQSCAGTCGTTCAPGCGGGGGGGGSLPMPCSSTCYDQPGG
jgi:hypothetical protein